MTDVEKNAARNLGPTKNLTGNSPILKITTAATHVAKALPDTWQGRFVKLRAIGADVDYYFSPDASASVVFDEAATAGGTASVTRGRKLIATETEHVIVPKYAASDSARQTIYIVMEAAGAGSMEISLAE